MNVHCPHCHQPIDFDDDWAGNTVECPNCHQSFLVPRSVPPGKTSESHSGKKRLGCEFYLWLLIAVGMGAFGYAMHRWQATPRQTLQHLVTAAQRVFESEPSPSPSGENMEETPVATAQPTPTKDPLPWLIAHKESWPNEVILREPLEFPAVSGGKKVGSLIVPAGSTLRVLEITREEIAADYMGGDRRVPITSTDLAARANVILRKTELEAQQNRRALVSLPPKIAPRPAEPENIREATREEINNELGALYTRQATTFRIFAPTARTVSVAIYDEPTGNEGRTVRPLRQQSNNLWDETVRGNCNGKFYAYLLDQNDPKRAREVLDPYATNSVANSTRGRITPLTVPVAPGPKLESPTDAIIYEMHVRDFTVAPNSGVQNAGLYLGFTEGGTRFPGDPQIQTAVDHLVELGVTHVELMPVQDFENDESAGSYNWGYITTAFFSPEGMFATNPNDNSRVRELHALVAALHARGIGVIMDVVYNHTSGNASLMSIGPEYYYRRSPNGSFSNGSGCGNEFKSEASMGRRLILDSLKFWAKEYGIDGFRFDLMALIDQETIRQADRELRAMRPGIILFGEPWTGGNTPLRDKTDKTAIRRLPAGAFNDDFRNALKGAPDGNDSGWIQNGSQRDALKAALLVSSWFASPDQSINYMTCHDNLVLWDKLAASMPNAGEALRIDTMKLGYLALFTSQGVPFVHGGEEIARTKGGNNNSFEAPDSVNEVDWSLKKEHLDLFNFVRDAIALRKAHPMFRLRTRPEVASRVQFLPVPNQSTLMFMINGDGISGEAWRRVCVVLNAADETDNEISLPPGEWSVALDANGATASAQVLSGKVIVRRKSGVVLFQSL